MIDFDLLTPDYVNFMCKDCLAMMNYIILMYTYFIYCDHLYRMLTYLYVNIFSHR